MVLHETLIILKFIFYIKNGLNSIGDLMNLLTPQGNYMKKIALYVISSIVLFSLIPAFAQSGDMTVVEFLSEEPVREFSKAEWVLQPGKDYWALIKTSKGNIYIDLFEREAPRTVNNFVFLSLNRYYEDVPFHRVLEGFMAQTGDPTGTGRGNPGYFFNDEFNSLLTHNQKGVVSMANTGPNSNGSQFFITFGNTSPLDYKHSIFGLAKSGLDVLDRIQRIDPNNASNLLRPESPVDYSADLGVSLRSSQTGATIEDVIMAELGGMPELYSVFKLQDYWAVLQQGSTPDEVFVGFWQPADVMEKIYILVK